MRLGFSFQALNLSIGFLSIKSVISIHFSYVFLKEIQHFFEKYVQTGILSSLPPRRLRISFVMVPVCSAMS